MLNSFSILKYIRLTGALVLLSVFISGKAQEVVIKAELDTNRALIGDQLKLTLSLEKPADLEIDFPQLKDTLTGKIEITGAVKTDTTRLASGRMLLDRTLMLMVFDTGYFEIPALDFLAREAGQTVAFSTQPIFFEILPVKSDSTIRDIKENYKAPVNLAEILYYIREDYHYGLILLGAGLLAWFLVWYFRKRRKRGKPEMAGISLELPEVTALRELEHLKADKPWLHGQVKQYHIRISEVLRQYIERHYQFMALEQTTDEILQALSTSKLKSADLTNLAGILRLNDLVKFAKVIPDASENARQADLAIDFIHQSVASDAVITGENETQQHMVKTNAVSENA